MVKKNIEINFLGTLCFVSNKDGDEVKIGSKAHSNIRKSVDDSGCIKYKFSGPGPLDIIKTNIANNIKNGTLILEEEIDKYLEENKDDDGIIQITVLGHSRGGVAATRVSNTIRSKYSSTKKVKVILRVTDPYAGPTHSGENVSIDLKKESKESKELEDDVVFYSMGTAIPCSPQKVMNAKTIIVCKAGHNLTGGLLSVNMWDENKENFNKITQNGGVYLQEYDNRLITKEITEKNLKEIMNTIYSWQKNYSVRTRLLTEVIIKKLKIRIDKILEDEVIIEWGPAFNKTIEKIKNSSFLKTAFNYVFELFDDKLFGPYINKKGKFFSNIEKARDLVVGIKNDDYENALEILSQISKNPKQPYKQKLANALIDRIKKYYKK